jgi:transcriptional regulator with PAS, ATPase and Fis domain
LQEGAVRPIGGHTEISVDVRVIVATNRNLGQAIGVGRFREDLFYRVAVLTIDTPPLRNHSSDIPLLVEYVLRQADEKMKCPHAHRIEEKGLTALSEFSWPGNVRQLRHVIERLVATTLDPRWLRNSQSSFARTTRSMISLTPCCSALMNSCGNRPTVTAKPRVSYGSIEFPFTSGLNAHGSALGPTLRQEKSKID